MAGTTMGLLRKVFLFEHVKLSEADGHTRGHVFLSWPLNMVLIRPIRKIGTKMLK
jgi:hypothetical protein